MDHVRRSTVASVVTPHTPPGAWTAFGVFHYSLAPPGSLSVNARLEPFLYRFGARFFAGFLALALLAFWPSYFARLFEQPSLWFHAHGVVLTLWLVMLVVQAQLIRTQRRAWHRAVGKLSYGLAPAVVVISTLFVHGRLTGGQGVIPPRLPPLVLHFLALTLLSLLMFAIFYGLAIARRRDAQVHARWMICTLFPLFTPVTDRLVGAYAPPLIAWVPRIESSPILPAVGFALADLILLALTLWDWRANRRFDVFPTALAALLVYHLATLGVHRVPAWNTFCVTFLNWPLT
jgi:hypothetical protein